MNMTTTYNWTVVQMQAYPEMDGEAYLENRWFNEEGKPNVRQIMADKYVLENLPRILQKVELIVLQH